MKPRRPRVLQRLFPFVTLVISLAVVAVSTWLLVRTADNEDRANFRAEVEQLKGSITTRVDSQESLLRGAAGLFALYPSMGLEDFQRYVAGLNLNKDYPGTMGVGFLQHVKASDAPAFELRLHKEAGTRYSITPTFLASPRDDAYAVLFFEPDPKTGPRNFGFDMSSEPRRKEAIDRAVDSGNPALGDQVQFLHQAPGGDTRPGFHLFMPIYRTTTDGMSIHERREAALGLVFCPFRSEELVNQILKDSPTALSFALYDGTSSEGSPFYGSKPPHITTGKQLAREVIDVGDHNWTVVAWRNVGLGSDISRIVPAIGFCISLVLFLLSLSETRARLATENAMEELQRSEKGQRLLAQSGAALSQSLHYDETLRTVAKLAVPEFADTASVDILGPDGAIERLIVEHHSTDKDAVLAEVEKHRPRSPKAKTIATRVLETGEIFFSAEVTAHTMDDLIENPEYRAAILQLGIASLISVPIANRGKTYGVLSLSYSESGRHYSESDVEMAREIGLRAGLAVENSINAQAALQELEERKRAEGEIRRLNRDLERTVQERTRELAVANQELEAFCYSVSHDLRAPLRSVDGFSKAVLDDNADRLNEESVGYLKRVRLAARRMDELITALLQLSRITRSEMAREPVNLSKMASQVAEEEKALAASSAQFLIQPDLTAEADPQMMRLVFDNLISNALKFSSKTAEPCIEIGSEVVDGSPAFFIRDNGAGFNPEYGSKLFAPFERLHSSSDFPGSGVGLATVQRIIQKHGGRVWAKGAEGQGATFYFTLP